ncbi:MAG TPA: RNA polymerase sigma factor [Nitriliruptorales bacterium]
MLGAVRDQDEASLRELYDRHAPWLRLRLARRCADRDIVEEVLQDTFVVVWRKAARFRGEGDVGAWIWGIAIRRLLDRFRRQRPVLSLLGDHAGAASAEEQVLEGVEFGDLGGALNRLSPELRAVVRATVLDGLTTREAARLLGVPQGTVKTRMMRARAQLREELA